MIWDKNVQIDILLDKLEMFFEVFLSTTFKKFCFFIQSKSCLTSFELSWGLTKLSKIFNYGSFCEFTSLRSKFSLKNLNTWSLSYKTCFFSNKFSLLLDILTLFLILNMIQKKKLKLNKIFKVKWGFQTHTFLIIIS